jgi:Zn-dependent M16 (insulinase) family peptidase
VTLSWLLGDILDTGETMALSALTEILLGHDGAPLTRLLVESGLGEDLAPASGLETELRETVFTVGLRGVDRTGGGDSAEKIAKLIQDELLRLASEGIPEEQIEAALLSMEFSNREIRRAGGPYSLVWMRRSLRAWLHGGRPWDSLLFAGPFEELKRGLAADSRYFEKLIRRCLVDNPRRALVSVVPQPGLQDQKDAALAAELAQKAEALTPEERQDIIDKAAELERIQSEKDSPEALAAIPHLSRKDLVPDIETVPRTLDDAGGVPVISHEIFANGVSYGDFFLPLDILDSADYPWLPLFSRAVVSLGLPGMDYAEVSGLLARITGSFYATLQSGSALRGSPSTLSLPTGTLDLAGRDWLCFRLKALDEKMPAALDLARRLILEADFSDRRRVRDLVLEMRNDMGAGLAPGGHAYAGNRSGRLFSRSKAVDELWGGVTQLETVHRIAAMDIEEICAVLTRIRDTLINHGGLLANIAGSAGAVAAAQGEIARQFGGLGAPRPRKLRPEDGAPFYALVSGSEDPAPRAEVLSSPSLQVGFAAMALPGASLADGREAGTEAVLAHWLSTGALWEELRMKGGAYGAFAGPDGMEGVFTLSTYRDPNALRSLEAFPAILREAARSAPEEEALVKAVIGSFSRETRPRSPAEKTFADCLRFLYGIEDRRRREKLEAIVATTAAELAGAAERLAASAEAGPGIPTILAGTAEAERIAAKLGVEIRTLPV